MVVVVAMVLAVVAVVEAVVHISCRRSTRLISPVTPDMRNPGSAC